MKALESIWEIPVKTLAGAMLGALIIFVSSCGESQQSSSPSPTPTANAEPLQLASISELKYLLIDRYGDIVVPEPVGVPEEVRLQQAKGALSTMRADSEAFQLILDRLGLIDQPEYGDSELLDIFDQFRTLNAVGLERTGNEYEFSLVVIEDGFPVRVEGRISAGGAVAETGRNPAILPICLSEGTLIDTPTGATAIEELNGGAKVWTLDSSGQRREASVKIVASALAPNGHIMLSLSLEDGRSLLASPGHPALASPARRTRA